MATMYSSATGQSDRIASLTNQSKAFERNTAAWNRRIFPDPNDEQAKDRRISNISGSPSLLSAITSPPGTASSLVVVDANTSGVFDKNRPNPSFYHHLMKLEKWAYLVGGNLLAKHFQLGSKGQWKAEGHSSLSIYFWRLFLLAYILREFIGGLVLRPSDAEIMLYIGDFSHIYGVHVDRFSFNAFKFCWGLHALIVYFWITRANGKVRKWLANFEKRWMETAYYVKKDLEVESLRRMRSGRVFATRFIQVSTLLAAGTITALNVYGFLNESGRDYLQTRLAVGLYFGWCLVHLLWFWATFVINLTAFGHHFLLCRAIHIRFDETKRDLEYAILSEFSSNTKPEQISNLITKHYYVCDMVKQANRHLKVYLFVFYMIFAPHLCLVVYQIIFSTNFTAQGRILLGFLLILSDFFQVYSVSVLSAQITSKSHEPYYAMHGVNKFENLPENIQLQSTLFMQRISNTVVGLTILDSFVLTGGLISSLITAIVTYFSVILESS